MLLLRQVKLLIPYIGLRDEQLIISCKVLSLVRDLSSCHIIMILKFLNYTYTNYDQYHKIYVIFFKDVGLCV